MSKSKRDAMWGIFFLVASAGIFFYSDTFVSSIKTVPLAESSVYSKLWAVVLFALSLMLLVRSLAKPQLEKVRPLITFGSTITVAALFLYLLLLKSVGFLLCTIVFLTLLITYYHWLSTKPEERVALKIPQLVLKYVALSVVVAFVLQYAFGKLLGVYLPQGNWLS